MAGRRAWRMGPGVVALVVWGMTWGAPARAQERAAASPAQATVASPASGVLAVPVYASDPAAATSPGARAGVSASMAAAPPRLDPRTRMRNYVHDLTGVGAILGVAGGAAFDQLQTRPAEWGDGFSGFAKRVGSHAGALVVGETVHHELAYEMNETTRYERCGCRDFSMQAQRAFTGAVTDRDLDTGRRVISVPRIAGAFAGSFAPMIWQPGYSAGNAIMSGALTLVASGVFNLADELLHTPRVVATARRAP